MFGGGNFQTMNKELPGAYINVVSVKKAAGAVSDRGYASMPMELDWGKDGEMITLTNEILQKDARKLFGYAYTAPELADIRDVFCHATTLYLYRLNSGGEKASNDYCTAVCSGTRGNSLKVVIAQDVDSDSQYVVKLYMTDTADGQSVDVKLDEQTVAAASDLENNDYVEWKSGAALTVTAGVSLSGGSNASVTGDSHSAYLAALEPYYINTFGVKTADETVKKLYVSYVKRMRDEVGSKFQLILHNYAGDYEGVINVKNSVKAVPWVVGAEAGCNVEKSCTNMTYDGEADVPADYTQIELKAAMKAGEFVFHKVGEQIRVLSDINSLLTYTEDKSKDFASNQVIRVVDQIATDIASIYVSRYIGKYNNNATNRTALWKDITGEHEVLAKKGAIDDYDSKDVEVTAHETDKKAVVVTDQVQPAEAMEKLYMTIIVR